MTSDFNQILSRAFRAEAKQGYLNTGAWDGFAFFVREALPRLKEQGLPVDAGRDIRDLTEAYEQASPFKRRALYRDLERCIEPWLQKEVPSANGDSASPSPKERGRELDAWLVVPETDLEQNAGMPPERSPKANPSPGPRQNSNRRRSAETDEPPELQYIKGVGPQRLKRLQALGITTVEELLRHFPRRYEMVTERRIADLRDGELATVVGTVVGSQVGRGRIKIVKMRIEQDGWQIDGIWFNQVHIPKTYPIGTRVALTGKVQWVRQTPEILAADIEKRALEPTAQGIDNRTRLIPVYAETVNLNSKVLRTIMHNAERWIDVLFPEILPAEEQNRVPTRPQAYRELHFPTTQQNLQTARERLIREEILLLQLAFARLRTPTVQEPSPILAGDEAARQRFISALPFRLTAGQERVSAEIARDMRRTRPMARLLQGDVGSGKTVVAMLALLQAVSSGYQGTLMAPTEILAQQHFSSLERYFAPFGIRICLLSGGQAKSERERSLAEIYAGKVQIVVGTHALIQEDVRFNALGLVVADEQHRFGVRQRTRLQEKGENPHVLVMTATPIPRTLALTLYGDLQLSVLDELPQGRKPIVTRRLDETGRARLQLFMEQEMRKGRQIYVVCPLVEETEKSDFISASERWKDLQSRFPDRTAALVHGRLKSQEKEEIMRDFQAGRIDILVATTVVEVGIDVPNATVMVIENAERFGLAQLHQLRGRVGRGGEQSYCILISSRQDSARLHILCETENGFRIAEEDLNLRGPGEVLGIRQHGFSEIRLFDLSRDGRLVEESHELLGRVLAAPEKYAKVLAEAERRHPLRDVGFH